MWDQCGKRIIAKQSGEETADRRKVGDLGGGLGRQSLGGEAAKECPGQFSGNPYDHEGEEHPHRKHHARVDESRPDARARTSLAGGKAVHDANCVRRHKEAGGQPVYEKDRSEDKEVEVHRQGNKECERDSSPDHAAGGKGARSVAVG